MARIECWFPTPIYFQENLISDNYNRTLEKEILTWPDKIPSGGTDWEGGTYTTHITHDLKEAISLSQRIVFLDSKPMKIILDFENNKDFSSNLEDVEIEKIKESILKNYPKILSGNIFD